MSAPPISAIRADAPVFRADRTLLFPEAYTPLGDQGRVGREGVRDSAVEGVTGALQDFRCPGIICSGDDGKFHLSAEGKNARIGPLSRQ